MRLVPGRAPALSLVPLLVVLGCGAAPVEAQLLHVDIPVPPAPRAATGPARPAPTSAPPAKPGQGSFETVPVTKIPVPAAVQAIVDATDRLEADRKLDAGRHPGETLAFLDLKPGMRVAEVAAGGGYTTELLARAVGPRGKVWAEENAVMAKFVEKPWAERAARPSMKAVARVDRELDAPLPPEAKGLDAVVDSLFYHDTVWMGADRAKMNHAVFDALRRGGEYVILDHSAIPGHGLADVKSIHRIDELTVIHEIERAGFQLAATADFLRNPADTRDWNDSPRESGDRRGTSDRFVLKFVKP